MLNTKGDAFLLLEELGAPPRLVKHANLVNEAAEMLIEVCSSVGVSIDEELVRISAVLHDVGKILHPNEMSGPGSEHETEGRKLLLGKGVPAKIARLCISHARWKEMECSLEELLVALADKLWKGKRVSELELEVTDRIAAELNVSRWVVFSQLDGCFENIAKDGDERLQRSACS